MQERKYMINRKIYLLLLLCQH